MKRRLTSIALFLAMLLAASLTAVYAFGGGGQTTITPFYQCDHDWSIPITEGAPLRKHFRGCTKCGNTLTENCYINEFCGNYPNSLTEDCDFCITGQAYIHDFDYVHSGQSHRRECINLDNGTIPCTATQGDLEACTLTPEVIWKGYVRGKGHRTGFVCTLCEYFYFEAYYNPGGHANGQDPDCEFCKMSDNYIVFRD